MRADTHTHTRRWCAVCFSACTAASRQCRATRRGSPSRQRPPPLQFRHADASSLAADALADAIGRTRVPLLRGLEGRALRSPSCRTAGVLIARGDEVVRVGAGAVARLSGPENGLPGAALPALASATSTVAGLDASLHTPA